MANDIETAAIELLNRAGLAIQDGPDSPHLDRAYDPICEAINEVEEAELQP